MSSDPRQGAETELHEAKIPFAQDAEACVLGAMLMDSVAVDTAMELLTGDSFYLGQHQQLFTAIAALVDKGIKIDPISLSDELRKLGQLDSVGGMQFIYDTAGAVPTAANVEFHAVIVRDKFWLRRVQEICQRGLQLISQPVKSVSVLRDDIEAQLLSVGQDKTTRVLRIGEYIPEYMDSLEERAKGGGGISGIRTGFEDLDYMLGGLQGGDLCIVAGYPRHGKTAFALQVALNCTRILPHMSQQEPTAFFSLEMSVKKQLMTRVASTLSGIEMQSMKLAKFSDGQWADVNGAMNEIDRLPLFVEHCPGIQLLDLRAKARRLRKTDFISVMIVDYLQLVRNRAENRQQEVSSIARGLKNLAGELDIPVIALAQLNRNAVQRADPSPTIYDLRESGDIENAADQILFVYRPGQEKQVTVMDGQRIPIPKEDTDILLEKNRNGPTGSMFASFEGATQTFRTRSNR